MLKKKKPKNNIWIYKKKKKNLLEQILNDNIHVSTSCTWFVCVSLMVGLFLFTLSPYITSALWTLLTYMITILFALLIQSFVPDQWV